MSKLLFVLLCVGCVEPDDSLELGASTEEIIHALDVAPGQLRGVVKVAHPGSGCTGFMIANDTVITAAHCFCDDNGCLNGPYHIDFRNPTTGVLDDSLSITNQFGWFRRSDQGEGPDDLGILQLTHPAPAWVPAYHTARANPADGTPLIVTGYGLTGTGCTGAAGTLHYDADAMGDIDNGMIRFFDAVDCPGDSGGPFFLNSGSLDTVNTVVGIDSGGKGSVWHAETEVGASTAYNNAWIKGFMCKSSRQNTCTGDGDPCSCSASTSLVWQVNRTGTIELWRFDAAGNQFHQYSPGATVRTVQLLGVGDFGGDNKQDLVFRNGTSITIWYLSNTGAVLSTLTTSNWSTAWSYVGAADFDGDGRSDIVWRNTTGQLQMWMGGSSASQFQVSYGNTGNNLEANWIIQGFGDFDGDGKADFTSRDTNTGATAIWFMNGHTWRGDAYPGVAPNVHPNGIGDFNGDGKSDILWQDSTGKLSIWFGGTDHEDGPSYGNGFTNGLPTPVSGYEVIGISDINHDGRADIIWRDAGHNGTIAIWLMDGRRFVSELHAQGTTDAGSRVVDSTWQSYGTYLGY